MSTDLIKPEVLEKVRAQNPVRITLMPAHKSPNNGEGAIQVVVVAAPNHTVKTHSKGIKLVGAQAAYDYILSLAKEYSEKLGIPYTARTLSELLEIIDKGSNKKFANSNAKLALENPLVEKFGNLMLFKATIRHAYREFGYDKVKHILDESQILLDECSAADRARLSADMKAVQTVASGLVKLAKETGFDMYEHCATPDVKRAYRRLMNPNTAASTDNCFYILNGERWDGFGHPPASFIKWRKENNKEDYQELRA